MLISPPFLPARADGDLDSAWLEEAMFEPWTGRYPVGQNMCWHGGTHLKAPDDATNQPLPVCAIADGTVVFVKIPHVPTPQEMTNPASVLCYDSGRWTSDGAVVIEHNTAIGAAGNNLVNVRFYSIYHHLREVSVARGDTVYRKGAIGRAGYIAGEPDCIHFEIACDAANLQRLIGRATGELSTAANGRTDVVFGDIHFWLPAGTPYYDVPAGRRLVHNQTAAHTRATTGHAAPTPLAEAGRTTEGLYVRLHYAMGEGPAANRGDITLTLRNANGQLNTSITEAGGEYDTRHGLYKKAESICNDWPAATRPVHFLVYELLRFGRVIEPGAAGLANVPHWRKLRIPNVNGGHGASGERWVNLNNQAQGQRVTVFSDADFPHWRGWQIINDDSAPDDNRCDSETIRAMAYSYNANAKKGDNEAGRVSLEALLQFMRKNPLPRAICNIPCEWDKSTIDARWGWLKTSTPHNRDEKMSDDDYEAFTNFVKALSFEPTSPQTPLPQGLLDARWRFHPKAFIEAFRKCGWLSEDELKHVIRNIPAEPTTGMNADQIGTRWATQVQFNAAKPKLAGLNVSARKYLISGNPLRMAHYLAQLAQETGWFITGIEYGPPHYFRQEYEVITQQEAEAEWDAKNNTNANVDANKKLLKKNGINKWPDTLNVAPPGTPANRLISRANYATLRMQKVADKAADLGNTQTGDGIRFKGRGNIQLTGRSNYTEYETYRGRNFTTDPNNELLETDLSILADVGGFYWAKTSINEEASAGDADNNINRVGGKVNTGKPHNMPNHAAERRTRFRTVWKKLNDVP